MHFSISFTNVREETYIGVCCSKIFLTSHNIGHNNNKWVIFSLNILQNGQTPYLITSISIICAISGVELVVLKMVRVIGPASF